MSNGTQAIDTRKLESSVWAKIASQGCDTRQLQGATETEVAIVGAGFTGTSTALHLAEKGIDSVVLEAEQIGFGCSSRNQGTLAGGYYASTPGMIKASYGQERGDRMNRMMAASTSLVFELVEKHRIECGLVNTGLIWAGKTEKERLGLEQAASEWKEYGVEVEALRSSELPDYLGTDYYHSGHIIRKFGRINPAAYVRGLAIAAQNAGARIFTDSRVLAIEPYGKKWKVKTATGEVVANKILIGTNGTTDNLWPGLRSSFFLAPVHMTATDPLEDGGLSMIPKGVPFHDTSKLTFFGVLLDHEGRLTGGVMPTFNIHAPIEKVTQPINWKYAKLYPDLPLPEWKHLWLGRMCMTSDSVARVYRLDNNVYAAMGYSGAGIAPATAMGKEVAGLLAGSESDCAWPISGLKPFRLKPVFETGLKFVGGPLLRQGYRFV
ncbi:MAG: FAD-binding oxidoreductase [Pseudomonadota bacterium]|nr:FAD-binding oxidoreductase [Pseudomonadota bacterium]